MIKERCQVNVLIKTKLTVFLTPKNDENIKGIPFVGHRK